MASRCRSWQQADLGEPADDHAWRLWQAAVVLPDGGAELLAQAWDTAGALQPESPEPLWNPIGYVNNSWRRNRLHVRAG